MKITAVIQARMTSHRLPGKVLMEVKGRPLLSYQIEQVRHARKIDDILIATTKNMEDDPIAQLARKEGLEVYRGSEHDVLDRYYQAAQKHGIEHILRLTGDCPLIDPIICDYVINLYMTSGADFVHTGPTFAEGNDCEIFSFINLEKAWNNAKLKSEREHCTLYLHNHPEKFNKIVLTNDTDDSKYRFTVDNLEDFLVVKEIIERIGKRESTIFKTDAIKNFFDTNPEIFKLNAHITRNEGLLKSFLEDKKL